MKFIAIDVGSSFIKSALLDMDSYLIVERKKIASHARTPSSDPNIFEIAADVLVNSVIAMIHSFTAKYRDIVGLVFCTQMHGFVYTTQGKENMYVSWQDMRCLNMPKDSAKNFMDLLREKFSYEDMKQCGVYIKPSLGMCNLWSIFEMECLSRKGELFTLGSYIISRLTGINTCHPQNAAPLGLFNVIEKKWDNQIITGCRFEDIKMPFIAKNDFEPVGIFFSNGSSISIFPDYGDQQTSILGSMADFGDAVINISTGSQVVVPKHNFCCSPDYETRPYFESTYINTISNMPGGRGLDVLINFLRNSTQQITGVSVSADDVWNAVHKSFKAETNGIKVDTCFFPVPQNLEGGKIQGILPSNLNLSSLFAAAFLDMSSTYFENINKITHGEKIERLICAGGVSWKTPELVNTIERVFSNKGDEGRGIVSKQCEVEENKVNCVLSALEDESLCGLFRVGLVCSGKYKTLQETVECVERLIKNENS